MLNNSHSLRPRPPALMGFRGVFEDKDFTWGLLELCWRRCALRLHQRRETLTVLRPYYHPCQVVLAARTCMNQDLEMAKLLLGGGLKAKRRSLDWQPRSNVSRRPKVLSKKGHSLERAQVPGGRVTDPGVHPRVPC